MSAIGSFELALTPQLEDDIDAGRMLIDIEDGQRNYRFEYQIDTNE